METARELATRSSGINAEMMQAAEKVLGQYGGKIPNKRFPTPEIIYEMLSAALQCQQRAIAAVPDETIKTEQEWLDFFDKCKVRVTRAEVGSQILKIGTENEGIYNAMISRIIQDSGLVVALKDYPGVTLFNLEKKLESTSGKHVKSTVRVKKD